MKADEIKNKIALLYKTSMTSFINQVKNTNQIQSTSVVGIAHAQNQDFYDRMQFPHLHIWEADSSLQYENMGLSEENPLKPGMTIEQKRRSTNIG